MSDPEKASPIPDLGPLDPSEQDPNELELAWSAEIQRRMKKLDDGKAKMVSEEDFFRRLRAAK